MDIDDIHSDGRCGESATISRSFILVKHSTLITEFSIYKLNSDLQRVDVRRYNGVFVTNLLQTRNSENFAYKSRWTVQRNGNYGSRPSFSWNYIYENIRYIMVPLIVNYTYNHDVWWMEIYILYEFPWLTLLWDLQHYRVRQCYNFCCTSNVDFGGNLSRWTLKWEFQLNFQSLYIIWRQLFRGERSVSLWMIFAMSTEGDDVHCNLFYASTTGFDGEFLRWIARWKFRLHIWSCNIIRSRKFRRWMEFLLRQSQRSSVAKLHWCKRRYVNVVSTTQPRSPTIDRKLTQRRRRNVRIAESKISITESKNWRFNVF